MFVSKSVFSSEGREGLSNTRSKISIASAPRVVLVEVVVPRFHQRRWVHNSKPIIPGLRIIIQLNHMNIWFILMQITCMVGQWANSFRLTISNGCYAKILIILILETWGWSRLHTWSRSWYFHTFLFTVFGLIIYFIWFRLFIKLQLYCIWILYIFWVNQSEMDSLSVRLFKRTMLITWVLKIVALLA